MARGRSLLLFALALAGCPPFPEDGPYRCEQDSDCDVQERCAEGSCVPACEPAPCEGRCGRILDGCGGQIECTCEPPATCGGGGRAGFCGCTPLSCADYPDRCGTFDDGCGATFACICDAPNTCGGGGEEGVCGCTLETCGSLGLECGSASDGCGGTLECGSCTWPDWCGGLGPNACGRPASCTRSGAECGFVQGDYCGTCKDGEMCGVPGPNRCGRPTTCLAEGRTCGFSESTPGLFCGGCPLGQMCDQGACVAAERPFCWSEPERISFLSTGLFRGVPAAENGQLWFYGYFEPGDEDPGCTRYGRMQLLDYTRAATATFEQIAASDFSELDPEGCRRTGSPCDGWVGPPQLRADGLEMVFNSSYVCGDWQDRELYLSSRTATDQLWSTPRFIPVSRYDAGAFDTVDAPVLLPDLRTLVYNGDGPGAELRVARRPTPVPGDADFQRVDPVQLAESATVAEETLHTLRAQGVSCDGRYLLYYRDFWLGPPGAERHEVRRAEILSMNPLILGSPMPVDVPIGIRPDTVQLVGETPDCEALFYGTERGMYVQRRVPCR